MNQIRNPATASTHIGRSISSKSRQSHAHTIGKMIHLSHLSAIATTGDARRWLMWTSVNDTTIAPTMIYRISMGRPRVTADIRPAVPERPRPPAGREDGGNQGAWQLWAFGASKAHGMP